MTKPNVTASFHQDKGTMLTIEGNLLTWPAISLEVTFPFGGHEQALALLEMAAADVKNQIEQTRSVDVTSE